MGEQAEEILRFRSEQRPELETSCSPQLSAEDADDEPPSPPTDEDVPADNMLRFLEETEQQLTVKFYNHCRFVFVSVCMAMFLCTCVFFVEPYCDSPWAPLRSAGARQQLPPGDGRTPAGRPGRSEDPRPLTGNGTQSAQHLRASSSRPEPVSDRLQSSIGAPAPFSDTPALPSDVSAPFSDAPAPSSDVPAPLGDAPAPVSGDRPDDCVSVLSFSLVVSGLVLGTLGTVWVLVHAVRGMRRQYRRAAVLMLLLRAYQDGEPELPEEQMVQLVYEADLHAARYALLAAWLPNYGTMPADGGQ